MWLLRSAVSVVAGYLVFALSAFLLFRWTGQPPHQPAPAVFMIGSSLFGAGCALAGGYLAGLLAGRAPFAHGVAVGVVLALGAGVSMASTLGKGAIWSQAAALLLMAPAAGLGGWLRGRGAAQS